MTENFRNASNQGLRYTSPRVKVVEVKPQGMLCGSLDGSPITNEYNRGSESFVGFGDDEDD